MKLSDAIREGCKLHAASKSGWYDTGLDGEIRTCALMAAAVAVGLLRMKGGTIQAGDGVPTEIGVDTRTGLNVTTTTVDMPVNWLPVMDAREYSPCGCPNKKVLKERVFTLIWHLHDVHQWRREAVSEWIGTIEDKIASEALTKVSDAVKDEVSVVKSTE